jgi:hypothetical protein
MTALTWTTDIPEGESRKLVIDKATGLLHLDITFYRRVPMGTITR